MPNQVPILRNDFLEFFLLDHYSLLCSHAEGRQFSFFVFRLGPGIDVPDIHSTSSYLGIKKLHHFVHEQSKLFHPKYKKILFLI